MCARVRLCFDVIICEEREPWLLMRRKRMKCKKRTSERKEKKEIYYILPCTLKLTIAHKTLSCTHITMHPLSHMYTHVHTRANTKHAHALLISISSLSHLHINISHFDNFCGRQFSFFLSFIFRLFRGLFSRTGMGAATSEYVVGVGACELLCLYVCVHTCVRVCVCLCVCVCVCFHMS